MKFILLVCFSPCEDPLEIPKWNNLISSFSSKGHCCFEFIYKLAPFLVYFSFLWIRHLKMLISCCRELTNKQFHPYQYFLLRLTIGSQNKYLHPNIEYFIQLYLMNGGFQRKNWLIEGIHLDSFHQPQNHTWNIKKK